MRFTEIGQQLRAFRLESGLRAEEIAARLGVSRAALYRYEKGEVIKLDTIKRLAELLQISPLSLLGIGVEYYTRQVALLDRLRQIEENADQILVVTGLSTPFFTSDAYDTCLADMMREAANDPGPDRANDRAAVLSTIEQCLATIQQRKKVFQQRRPNLIALVSEEDIGGLLRHGVGGRLPLPEAVRPRALTAARAEVGSIAALMEAEPMGLQVGLIASPSPLGSFAIARSRDRAALCINPFPLDTPASAQLGVAMVTSADEAIAAHQRVAEGLWRGALKGSAGAAALRAMLPITA